MLTFQCPLESHDSSASNEASECLGYTSKELEKRIEKLEVKMNGLKPSKASVKIKR